MVIFYQAVSSVEKCYCWLRLGEIVQIAAFHSVAVACLILNSLRAGLYRKILCGCPDRTIEKDPASCNVPDPAITDLYIPSKSRQVGSWHASRTFDVYGPLRSRTTQCVAAQVKHYV